MCTCVHNRKSNPMDLICYKLIKKAHYGHIILKYPDLSDHIAKTQVSLICLYVDNFFLMPNSFLGPLNLITINSAHCQLMSCQFYLA